MGLEGSAREREEKEREGNMNYASGAQCKGGGREERKKSAI